MIAPKVGQFWKRRCEPATDDGWSVQYICGWQQLTETEGVWTTSPAALVDGRLVVVGLDVAPRSTQSLLESYTLVQDVEPEPDELRLAAWA